MRWVAALVGPLWILGALASGAARAEGVWFREDFDGFDGWRPATDNGEGCSWTVRNGFARVARMGHRPDGWIGAVYERELPVRVAPGRDFYLAAAIRVQDGDPGGACSGIGVNLVSDGGDLACRVNYNDSQAASGYGGVQVSTGLGMVYTNDPDGFSRNHPTFYAILELQRVGDEWTAYLNGEKLGPAARYRLNLTGAKVQITNSRYKDYGYRDGEVGYIEIGGLPRVHAPAERPVPERARLRFREDFEKFEGWRAAGSNGEGCSWTVEKGLARVARMGRDPDGWIGAVYERELPFEVPAGQDFYLRAAIRVRDGDPDGACSGVGVNLVNGDGSSVCRVNFNDSQAARGYGGVQLSTGLGMVYTNDPDGFSQNHPTFDAVLELRRVGTTWTAYMGGKPLGRPVTHDVRLTATKVQITNSRYKSYGYRDGEIDCIEVGSLP